VLSISPVVVLFAVFFWTFLWGLYGALSAFRSPSPR
jgi:AI-2 transport protein TqsA